MQTTGGGGSLSKSTMSTMSKGTTMSQKAAKEAEAQMEENELLFDS